MANKMTRLDYCQYLLVTQINYTLTNFADHSTKFSHDQINRFLIKGFAKEHKVKLFRVEVSTHRTDYVVTNDVTQDSTEATQKACSFRWKIEQLHARWKAIDWMGKMSMS